ncbi:MAG TPA: ribonuclease HII [Nitrososphaeraceae archaeon]
MQPIADDKPVLIGGVDEAGRGSIIGPLVIAGISIKQDRIMDLHHVGVRDSKMLTAKARTSLFAIVSEMVDSLCIYKIDCSVIDENVFSKGLNKLEAETMAYVIDNLKADMVYVDSCDTDPGRYKHYIESRLITSKSKLYSMHHADSLNIVVSAASIIAKFVRDGEIQEIRKTHCNIGSGYPSDVKTMRFIRNWVSEYKCAPRFARKSWRPLREMLEEVSTYKITQFNLDDR